jgi:hypothetical protein
MSDTTPKGKVKAKMMTKDDDALANLPTATAAHLRHLRASMEAKAAGGAEKWEAISTGLRDLIGEGNFARWFKDVKPALTTSETPHLRLAFPNAFIRDWIEANYSAPIRALWERLEPAGTLELAIQPAADPADVTRQALPARADKIIPFPAFPTETRPIVNLLVRSALFAAIQGKDRRWLQDEIIFSSGNTIISFTGEQLNQDDHDVLMQLAVYAGGRPAGEYIPLPVHSLLKDLGRGTSGKEHKQAEAEIKRLKRGNLEVKAGRYTYYGNLIDDAIKDDETGAWAYRLNENLRPLYEGYNYTLIDWERRKALKGKELARWLQLYLATHAEPFPVSVEFIRQSSGSKNTSLRDFRRKLKMALTDLQATVHIKGWRIDERDRVHVDRGDAITDSQRRYLDPPKARE